MEWFLNWLFPKKCVICGKEGSFLCEKCRVGLKPAVLRDTSEKGIMRALWSLYDYKQPQMRKLIKALKYRFIRGVVEVIMENSEVDEDWKEVDIIVPVPLHRLRENWRGFNQAELIAKVLAEKADRPLIKALERTRMTKPLAEMKRVEDRRREIQGVFKAKKEVVGKTVLLVDDVYTSGSTMMEAARELKRAGAKEVWGFVLAS